METMRSLLTSCVLIAALCGCAGGNVVECHGENWYRIGLRDATADGKDESKTIADSCGPAFDEKQYRAGFEAGMAQKNKAK